MEAGLYINFKNSSAEAMKFYEGVFNTKIENSMSYGQMPEDDDFKIDDSIKDLILNASMTIHEMNIMFSDVVDGMSMPLVIGNNITIVINTKDEQKLRNEFKLLAEGGNVTMPLEKTFWSELYGYVIDKYGIGWQFNLAK
ncbi:VOC family protein [Mycoplasma sp. P36-A1]|uniref:VOC family protein n=1 Tax=Mycoplasma sp. P36-A1 TaxID=3252900 RepID=UPI003C2E3889